MDGLLTDEILNTFATYRDEVRDLCTEKGWREQEPGQGPRTGHQLPAYLALIVSEVSEALEAFRDKVWSDTCPAGASHCVNPAHIKGCSGKKHDAPKPVGVGPELADALIRIIDTADVWGIDLPHEVNRVIEYGWTRSYRHGGRSL